MKRSSADFPLASAIGLGAAKPSSSRSGNLKVLAVPHDKKETTLLHAPRAHSKPGKSTTMSHRIRPLIFRRFNSSKSKSPSDSHPKPRPKSLRPLWLNPPNPQHEKVPPARYKSNRLEDELLSRSDAAVQRLRRMMGIPNYWLDEEWALSKEQKLEIYREKASKNNTINLMMASIGNPAPYERTRHSAAHIVLDSFSDLMGAEPPRFNKHFPSSADFRRLIFKELNISLTLWKSQSYMNASGRPMADAFSDWMWIESQPPTVAVPAAKIVAGKTKRVDKDQFRRAFHRFPKVALKAKTPQLLQLILLHDELEQPLGKISVRYGGVEMSARGHNGVKSVVKNLAADQLLVRDSLKTDIKYPLMMRVGIGVGRPVERTPEAVSEYLLGPMPDETYSELRALAPRLRDVLQKELAELELMREDMKIIDKPREPIRVPSL